MLRTTAWWSATLVVAVGIIGAARVGAAEETNSAVKAESPSGFYDPVVRQIEGWTVYIDPALLEGEHAEEGNRALTMLANHLQRIKIVVPPEPLAKLQKIEIWIEWANPQANAMCYHPDPKWVRDHGLDPRLGKKVHITHAAELYSRQQMFKHPFVIMHELAHAYHDQVLGFDDPRIIAAYREAKKSGKYDKVLAHSGRYVEHYAMKDHKEYFAEGTEAYLYRNDFFPFVRAELKEFDPKLHEVLKEIWGPAPAR
ncbi:MAG: metallopeptidase [Planctomycetota bacterium]|nr:MAG: metallopeptidase [Planctomycetota bacterium]